VRETQRQVGELRLDARGVAVRGLLLRHLVLPHGLAGTAAFIARELSPATYVNVMDQTAHAIWRIDAPSWPDRLPGRNTAPPWRRCWRRG